MQAKRASLISKPIEDGAMLREVLDSVAAPEAGGAGAAESAQHPASSSPSIGSAEDDEVSVHVRVMRVVILTFIQIIFVLQHLLSPCAVIERLKSVPRAFA